MIDRIVEVTNPARLSVRDCQLVIAPEGREEVTTPLSELAVLLIAHPRVTLTQAVLSRIALEGGAVVTCDDKFLPASMLLPLQAHFVQGERFARQIEMSLPSANGYGRRLFAPRLGRKPTFSASCMARMEDCFPCRSACARVMREMLSRRRPASIGRVLFTDPKFRRGGEGPDQNRHLDYGYTVLRAATARALCAAGLHPSIGLRHHNPYDAFSLAADMMEPFRPVVDRRVYHWIQEHDPAGEFDREARAWMLGLATERYLAEGEQRTLFDLLGRACNGLARAIGGEENAFLLPEELRPCVE